MNENIYLEIGKILCKIQHWENKFKLLTQKYNIEKSDDKRSLSNMNSFLLRNKAINNEEYSLIKTIIEMRNMVIHRMFVDYNNDFIKIEMLAIKISNTINESFKLFERLLK